MVSEEAMRRRIAFIFCLSAFAFLGSAQEIIRGQILDGDRGLPNVNVAIAGSTSGTATDLDGRFRLTTKERPPVLLLISAIGYADERIEWDGGDEELKVVLEPVASSLDQVVISASRYGERIMEAPVAIYKLSGAKLKQMGGVGAYESVESMRGFRLRSQAYPCLLIIRGGFQIRVTFDLSSSWMDLI